MLTRLLNRTVPPCADAVAGSRTPTAAIAASATDRRQLHAGLAASPPRAALLPHVAVPAGLPNLRLAGLRAGAFVCALRCQGPEALAGDRPRQLLLHPTSISVGLRQRHGLPGYAAPRAAACPDGTGGIAPARLSRGAAGQSVPGLLRSGWPPHR